MKEAQQQDAAMLERVEDASREVLWRTVEASGIVDACLFDGEPNKALRNEQRIAKLSELATQLDEAASVYLMAARYIRGES